MSESSRYGDSVHCLNFVASVPLTQGGGKGQVLTRLAVSLVRIPVALVHIPVKCTVY